MNMRREAAALMKKLRYGMAYPKETLDPGSDDGTIVDNVERLEQAVVGHKIVSAERGSVPTSWGGQRAGFIITLDNGKQVSLADTDDCCAYTSLDKFLLDPSMVDHIITGIGTTEQYSVWHIFADFGDIMKLEVGWSCGNPFYYGYGFDIQVIDNVE